MRHAPHGDYDYPHDDLWCPEFRPRTSKRPHVRRPGEQEWPKVDRFARAILGLSAPKPTEGVPDAQS